MAGTASPTPISESDDKLWATLAHFGGILGFLPPLIIWLVCRGRGPRTTTESKESLNFQITVDAVLIVLWILAAVLGATPLGVVLPILIALIYIASLVLVLMAGVKVNGGGSYRYPVNLRLIK